MDLTHYGKKRFILVVDGEQAQGVRLNKILKKYGYQVYTAMDLKDARRILAKKKKIDEFFALMKMKDPQLEAGGGSRPTHRGD